MKNVGILLLLVYALSGCASRVLMAGLAETEILALSTRSAVLGRYGMAVRGTELAITNESLFFSRLSRIRIEPKPFSSNPRLYVLENGQKNYFAIPKNARSIQFLEINRALELPEGSSLFRVKTNARVRMGPGTEYQLYKFREGEFLTKDQAVLVLKRVGNWYQVRLGKDELGYMLASLLVPITGDDDDVPRELRKPCDICQTSGYQTKTVDCETCLAKGAVTCDDCSGHGKNTCGKCDGAGKFVCKSCHGNGKTACKSCKGKGLQFGRSGSSICYGCDGTGILYCYACDRTGYTYCYACDMTGHQHCYKCNYTGSQTCTACRGDRQLNRKVQCTKCDGVGYMNASNSTTSVIAMKVKMNEDFTTNQNGWPTPNTSEIRSGVHEGTFVMESNSQNAFISVIPMPIYQGNDYTISVFTKHVTGVIDYGYGLCFSFLDYNNYYGFYIAEGNYKLFRRRNGKFEDLIEWTRTDVINRGAKGNTLKIQKKGRVCWLFINDQYVNKAFNFYELGPLAGLMIENYQTVSFDNLKVLQ